jgi:hypothetical protein
MVMDSGNQYFKKYIIHPKIPIVPDVRYWWIDVKWCQHDVAMVVTN